MLVFAVASYAQPFLIGQAIDKFIDKGDSFGLNMMGIALVALALTSWAAQYVQQSNTVWIGHRVLYTLRTKMFDHLMRLSLGFFDRNETGRVMSRVQNDVTVLQELLTTGLLTILSDFVGRSEERRGGKEWRSRGAPEH